MEKHAPDFRLLKTPAHGEMVEAIADALGKFVGGARGKMAVEDFAEKMNKSRQWVYQARSGEGSVSGPQLLQACFILGADFHNEVFKAVGIVGAHRAEGCPFGVLDIASRQARGAAMSSEAAADGIIDHQEAAKLASLYRADAAAMSEKAEELEAVARKGGAVPAVERMVPRAIKTPAGGKA